MYLFFTVFFVIALLLLCIFRLHRRKIIQKIYAITCEEKCRLLNEICFPYGYAYLPCPDLFTTTAEPWQREFGYQGSFDRAAPWLGMIFDCEPVYFDYQNKTWMIEFWKGQYGINTGAEIGVYHADTKVPKKKRSKAHYDSIADEETLPISMRLYTKEDTLANLSARHFWLAAFVMGSFHRPKDLKMDISITFPCLEMQQSFLDAMYEMGYARSGFSVCGSRVSFTFAKPHTPKPGILLLRWVQKAFVQLLNRLLCRLYLWVTRPFCTSNNRILYLYFHLPFAFRKTLCLHKLPRRFRRKSA